MCSVCVTGQTCPSADNYICGVVTLCVVSIIVWLISSGVNIFIENTKLAVIISTIVIICLTGLLILYFIVWNSPLLNQALKSTVFDCAKNGEMISTMDFNAGCCAGLEREDVYDVERDLLCKNPLYDIAICIDCPNSICGPGENKCNCPQDCR